MPRSPVYTGLLIPTSTDVVSDLAKLESESFDFVFVPLFHPRYHRDARGVSDARSVPPTRNDMVLTSGQWSHLVGGLLSPWLNLDSKNASERQDSQKAFHEEISLAHHLYLNSVIVPCLEENPVNLASHLNSAALKHSTLKLWVLFRVEEGLHSWRTWNRLRFLLCGPVEPVLELGGSLPSDVDLWFSEPVACVVLPTSIFQTNELGNPILSSRLREVVQTFLEQKVQILLKGRPHLDGSYRIYHQYLSYLLQQLPVLTEYEDFIEPFRDVLQYPLQPLRDHLETQVYEVFEKDPVKYQLYERAVLQTLTQHPDYTRVFVLGAGRGPLVRVVQSVASQLNRPLSVIALEKNPNAVIVLRNQKQQYHWDNVEVVFSDMRSFHPNSKADLIVSELLGSLGDNELSPECLYGAQKCLDPDHGVSIPRSSVSYVQPLMSEVIYREICRAKDPKFFESPLVVNFFRALPMSAPQPLFSFRHPEDASPPDFSRYRVLDFEMAHSGVVHGLAGFFESTLSDDFFLSTLPATKSEGMFSWFPLFLPFNRPVPVELGQTLSVAIWRKSTSFNVWYEWCVLAPSLLEIHNANGASLSMAL